MTPAKVELSPGANSDLTQIWDYIHARNPDAAAVLINAILDETERLLQAPLSGRLRSDLYPDLRSLPHGSYVIYYLPTLDGIRVMRVLHGARDTRRLFRKSKL